MKLDYIVDNIKDYEQTGNAGPKARNDINFFLSKNFVPSYFINGNNKMTRFVNFVKLLIMIRCNSNVVVVQYPYILNKHYEKMIDIFLLKRKSILVIHDIETLRTRAKKDDIINEIRRINQYRYVIAHNSHMEKWLKDNGCHAQIVNLEIFDYHCNDADSSFDDFINDDVTSNNVVAYAGNLSKNKSGFVYKWNQKNVILRAYGNNYCAANTPDTVKYEGAYNPDDLPKILNAKYGLVWDGDMLESCHGPYGDYLMYNNPHKTSLYLAAALPVIVWRKSAIADFVLKNNVGLVVDSLEELEDKINMVTDSSYSTMKSNAEQLAVKVRKGYYINRAIKECVEEMRKDNMSME